ncbi:unnamed protein product [Withania somnifera]
MGVEMEVNNGENNTTNWVPIMKKLHILNVLGEKVKKIPKLTCRTIWRVGKEDPRRVIHSIKVGFSLTLVSLLYLMEPLFNGFGSNAIWAVMTVVVVLEFTAGATLCKGLNRGLGTLLAGSLAFLIEYVATKTGHIFRAIFIGAALFFIACVNEYFTDEEQQKAKENSSDLEDPIYNGYKTVLDSKSFDETLALYASWEPRHSRHCYKFPWQQYVKLGNVLRHFGYTIVALHGCLQTEIQTPRSVRAMFKDPCIRLAGEVTKALKELGDSIRYRRHCSPEILSDHLHEALQDLNNAIKSQPKLFIGSKNNTNKLTLATVVSKGQSSALNSNNKVSLSSVKTDTSALLEWKSKLRGSNNTTSHENSKENCERKLLRPTLSKIAITSLEFSEALPFAAFASLLVEIVARLDLVIEEVEELGRIAHFKEYNNDDEHVVVKIDEKHSRPLQNALSPHDAGD